MHARKYGVHKTSFSMWFIKLRTIKMLNMPIRSSWLSLGYQYLYKMSAKWAGKHKALKFVGSSADW